MKIISHLPLKFALLVGLFSLLLSIKISSKNDAATTVDNSNFNVMQTPTVIGEMLKKIKVSDPKDNDLHKECLNLILATKNSELMQTFWEKIKTSQYTPTQFISRQIFSDFINSTSEGVVPEDSSKRECAQVIMDNMISISEFENPQKQKQLVDIVYPYFPRPIKYIQGKNIITAFIGVYRDTDEGRNLIPILNGKQ